MSSEALAGASYVPGAPAPINWTRENLAWLAGIVEGEGSITAERRGRGPRVKVKMTDEDVIRLVHTIAGLGHVYGPYKAKKPSGGFGKDQWVWVCNRAYEAYAMMVALAPWMCSRRRAQILFVVNTWLSCPKPTRMYQNGWFNTRAKFTAQIVDIIRAEYSGPESARILAERFNCAPRAIRNCAKGRTYADSRLCNSI